MTNVDLHGKTVLITGASQGIGAAAAQAFVAAGANVACFARNAAKLETVVADLGGKAIAIAGDVSRYDDVAGAVATTKAAFGGLDILIGNAGMIDPMGDLASTDPDAWGRTIDVNTKGVAYGMRAVLPDMIAQGNGTIITVSSGAAHAPITGWSAYCASKAAAYMLTRTADIENRAHGLRILGLSPGTVATDMQREIKDSGIGPVAKLDWSAHIQPDWPAKTLVWMCSPAADAHLGQDVSLREDSIRRAVGLI